MKEKIEQEIWNLHRKADQVRSIHGRIKDQYNLINKYATLFITIGSAIAAMLIFADIEDGQQLWVGLLSALIFIVSLLPGALKYENKIQERGIAVQLWGEWVRDARNFCNVKLPHLSEADALTGQNELLDRYKRTMESTPAIPDKAFNPGKRAHLQKVEISKALDKNPFKTIKEIKKELKLKMDKDK